MGTLQIETMNENHAYFLPLLSYDAETYRAEECRVGFPVMDYVERYHAGVAETSYAYVEARQRCMGLALVPAPSGERQTFVRIGRASIDMDDVQGSFERCPLPEVDIVLV